MRTRWAAALLSAGLAAAVLAGCATTVGGDAAPNAAAAAAALASAGATAQSGGQITTGPTQTTPSSPSSDSSTASSTPTETTGSSTAPPTTEGSSTDGSSTGASSTAASSAYPSAPVTYPATPATESSARLLEARRIAAVLLPPTLIDPTLTRGASLSTLPFKGPDTIRVLLGDPVPAVAARSGMITGFSSARSTADLKTSVVVAAFEYPDAAAAAKGAAALAAASANKADDTGKASIPGFKGALGWVGKSGDEKYTQAFLAQKSMVFYAWTHDPAGSAANQADRMGRLFQAELRVLNGFTPTPVKALMQLPMDVDGLRAHTLPNSGDQLTVVDGLYTGAAELHFDSDPVGTQKVFAAAGVDYVSQGRANLYRARNTAGATAVQQDFITFTQKSDPTWKPYSFTAVPGASCVQQSLNSEYYCVIVRGRYDIEVSSTSESDLAAAATAQYGMLDGY